MTSLADIHAWAGTTRSIAVCHICAAAVTVGVDAHDAGISADGVELFACGRCCETCREVSGDDAERAHVSDDELADGNAAANAAELMDRR